MLPKIFTFAIIIIAKLILIPILINSIFTKIKSKTKVGNYRIADGFMLMLSTKKKKSKKVDIIGG